MLVEALSAPLLNYCNVFRVVLRVTPMQYTVQFYLSVFLVVRRLSSYPSIAWNPNGYVPLHCCFPNITGWTVKFQANSDSHHGLDFHLSTAHTVVLRSTHVLLLWISLPFVRTVPHLNSLFLYFIVSTFDHGGLWLHRPSGLVVEKNKWMN